MTIKVDSYAWNAEPFKGRQHVVNHIDMILGLGTTEWSTSRERRLSYDFNCMIGGAKLSQLWRLDNVELKEARRQAQIQSLYAVSWEQVFPMHNGEYYAPDDVADDDLQALLGVCLKIWAFSKHFCDGNLDRLREETALVVLLGGWDPVRADRIVVRKRPDSEVLSRCVPVNSRATIANRRGNSLEWRAFGEHIAKNGHVLATLIERQEGVCPVCGGELGEGAVVHHVDYDHECGLALMGTRWTKPGTRVQPDCERCHVECPELFEECVSRLRAVHRSCNFLIEGTL